MTRALVLALVLVATPVSAQAPSAVATVRVIQAEGELSRARIAGELRRLRAAWAACAPRAGTARVVLYATVQRGRVVSSGIYGPHDGTTDRAAALCVEGALHRQRFAKSRTYRSSGLILAVGLAATAREANAALRAPGPPWLARARR